MDVPQASQALARQATTSTPHWVFQDDKHFTTPVPDWLSATLLDDNSLSLW
jgi:hypothetical protein